MFHSVVPESLGELSCECSFGVNVVSGRVYFKELAAESHLFLATPHTTHTTVFQTDRQKERKECRITQWLNNTVKAKHLLKQHHLKAEEPVQLVQHEPRLRRGRECTRSSCSF